jgi:cytochrome c oxidase subunit 2/cytochrome aa3-600 menaquinol oxidase subunit 2
VVLVLLTGCEGLLSTVDPAGPAARRIATLWWVMLSGAGLILLLVLTLVALPFWRAHRAPAGPRQEQFWIIGLGLSFPMVVLAALLAYGLAVGESLFPRDGDDIVRVGAQAERWQWTFTYEDAPEIVTENVLHIPSGLPIDVAITTADVIHSFWVPRLAGKLDAIPGHTNVLRIEADNPGSYAGVSAEFSGAGYDDFSFEVIAHSAADWAAFLQGEMP